MCSIAISCIRDAHERQAKQMLEERNEKKERSSSVNQIKQPKCSGNYTNLSTFGARKLIVAAQHVCLYKRKRRRRRRSISYKTHIQLLYFNQCIHRYIYFRQLLRNRFSSNDESTSQSSLVAFNLPITFVPGRVKSVEKRENEHIWIFVH